jgi:hypothetical protein
MLAHIASKNLFLSIFLVWGGASRKGALHAFMLGRRAKGFLKLCVGHTNIAAVRASNLGCVFRRYAESNSRVLSDFASFSLSS